MELGARDSRRCDFEKKLMELPDIYITNVYSPEEEILHLLHHEMITLFVSAAGDNYKTVFFENMLLLWKLVF